jgi:hypothetical protein
MKTRIIAFFLISFSIAISAQKGKTTAPAAAEEVINSLRLSNLRQLL